MKLNRLTIPFEIKEIDDTSDSDYYKFEGYGSTFGNVDLGDDKVVEGAFTRTIASLKAAGAQLPVLWQHDMRTPLGVYTDLREDGKGLFVNGKMPKADSFVSDRVFPQMKIGSVKALSIGYRIPKGGYEYVDGIRELKEIELVEISIVTMPMNPQAGISSVKGVSPYQDLPIAEDSTPWNAKDAIKRISEFTDDYEKYFLYCDPENMLFPFVDVIDEKLKVVPKAIFEAVINLRGIRDTINLSHEAVKEIENNISKYYEKTDRNSPLQNKNLVIDSTDLNLLTVRDIESILLSKDTSFTKKASKKLIRCLNVRALREEKHGVQRDAVTDDESIEMKLDVILNSIG